MANLKKMARKAVEQLVLCSTDDQRTALNAQRLAPIPEDLPAPVLEAFRHYAAVAEDSDFAIDAYQIPFQSGSVIVIQMVPDGSDGRFEAYTDAGVLVGAGQFLQNQVAWATPKKVRKLRASEFLPELQPELEWVEQPNGDQHSTCGRFQIRRMTNGWELLQLSATFPTLEEARSMAAHIAPFHED